MFKFLGKTKFAKSKSTPLPPGMKKRIRASVFANQDFLFIVAESGRIRTAYDYDAYSLFLSRNVSAEKLGGSIRDAFKANRFIEQDSELLEFSNPAACKKRADNWEAITIRKWNYKTKSQMYNQMAHLTCFAEDQDIIIHVSQKVGLKSYRGISEEFNLAGSSSNHEIGTTIKEAIAAINFPK